MTRDREMARRDFEPEHCPVCADWDIQGDSVDIEGHEARQEVACSNCDAVWVDVYRLDRRHIAPDGTTATHTLFIKDE